MPRLLRSVGRRSRWRSGVARSALPGRRPEGIRVQGLLDDADGIGVNVGSENVFEICLYENHVGAVLPSAENPVDALSSGIVPADDFVGLRREIEFATGEGESVGPVQRAQVDGRQRLAGREIDYRDRVSGALRASAVRG